MNIMNHVLKRLLPAGYALAMAALLPLSAAQAAEAKTEKPKPYPLKTCVVSGEKFGGDMGDPYVFTHQGREIKLCCKSCLKDFNKEPAKYIKKLEEAEKAAKDKKAGGSTAQGQSGHADHDGHKH